MPPFRSLELSVHPELHRQASVRLNSNALPGLDHRRAFQHRLTIASRRPCNFALGAVSTHWSMLRIRLVDQLWSAAVVDQYLIRADVVRVNTRNSQAGENQELHQGSWLAERAGNHWRCTRSEDAKDLVTRVSKLV